MDPVTFFGGLFVTLGLGLAARGGRKKALMTTANDDPKTLLKSGFGKGFLLPDIYWKEFQDDNHPGNFASQYYRAPKWNKLLAARDIGVIGCITKASDGVYWKGDGNVPFFIREWSKMKAAAKERYGVSFFRGAYHYLRAGVDGHKQALNYISTVEKGGGWDLAGDIIPIFDVERTGARNTTGSIQAFVDSCHQFCETVHSHWGRKILLYGRSVPNEAYNHGLDASLGADLAWNPAWTESLNGHQMPPPLGRERTALWQYTNGTYNKTNFPTAVPGFLPHSDMNVFVGHSQHDMLDLQLFKRMLIHGEV